MMFWLTDPEGDDARFYMDPVVLKPEARGLIELRRDDPTGKPLIRLPIPDGRDIDRMEEGYRLAVDICQQARMRRAGVNAPRVPPTRDELRATIAAGLYSIPHVVGTCRMGASPDDGAVVDADGHVHGVDNLFVADSSVIPDPTAGFPHIVTIAVAERIASALAAKR